MGNGRDLIGNRTAGIGVGLRLKDRAQISGVHGGVLSGELRGDSGRSVIVAVLGVSVRRRDNWFWFPAAILLHTLVDMVTILANAWLPIAATEVIAALLTLGSIALARKVYIEEKEDSLPPFSGSHP